MKSFSTSGIQIRFRTDSRTMFLKTEISRGSSRTYFAFDVFVGGKKIGSLDNFENVHLPQNYTTIDLPHGMFSQRFDLGTGDKEVRIYFPWSAKAVLRELSLDDGASVEPNRPSKKMICFGDSITQGYDALYPSNKYITKLADVLDAEEYNKAIGGERFFPELAAAKEDFQPDYIIVSYGTNDWCHGTLEEFSSNGRAFFCNLRHSYPNAKIFVITPIWRKDMLDYTTCGQFTKLPELIEPLVADLENVSLIRGFDFVPQNEELFADLRLHPNDAGFAHYFENLWEQIARQMR
jgi:lysophospholipase L1-like esterase